MPIDQRRYSEYASVMNETIRLRTWQKKPTKIDYIRKYRKEGKEEEVLRWPNLHTIQDLNKLRYFFNGFINKVYIVTLRTKFPGLNRAINVSCVRYKWIMKRQLWRIQNTDPYFRDRGGPEGWNCKFLWPGAPSCTEETEKGFLQTCYHRKKYDS